jgi:DNA-directed RNA polymerase subunit RPC12/RpoP
MSPKSKVDGPAIPTACGVCGARFTDKPWSPGDFCPKCGSDQYAPALSRDSASDYDRTDRSGAFAPEDIRFGRLAQWADLITPKQFQRFLHEQKRMAAARHTVTDIAALMLKEKLVTRDQVKAIHSARLGVPNGKADREFGSAAQKMGALTPNQLEECKKAQMEALREGKDPLPLPLLAYEKRYMPENSVVAILKGGELQGWGLLHRIKAGPEKDPGRFNMQAIFGAPHSHDRRVRITGIVVFLALLGVLSMRVVSGAAGIAHVRCIECNAEGVAPGDSEWPTKCPECRKLACYPMAICAECGARFTITQFGYGIACPACRSVRYVRIMNDNIEEVKAIEADIAGKPLEKEGGAP